MHHSALVFSALYAKRGRSGPPQSSSEEGVVAQHFTTYARSFGATVYIFKNGGHGCIACSQTTASSKTKAVSVEHAERELPLNVSQYSCARTLCFQQSSSRLRPWCTRSRNSPSRPWKPASLCPSAKLRSPPFLPPLCGVEWGRTRSINPKEETTAGCSYIFGITNSPLILVHVHTTTQSTKLVLRKYASSKRVRALSAPLCEAAHYYAQCAPRPTTLNQNTGVLIA